MARIIKLFFCALLVATVIGCAIHGGHIDRSRLPRVVLTFDDGFAEHYELVAPLVEKYGFRATFNVIVECIGKKGYMTWDQLRDLNQRGHAIENHTYSHQNLLKLAAAGKKDEIRREIEQAQNTLTREIGRRPVLLCHPYTATNRAIDEIIRDLWMTPMDCCRKNFGEGTMPRTESGAAAYIKQSIADGRHRIDILTHGVTKSGLARRPFPGVEVFEEHLKEIRELYDAGVIDVALYRDTID